MDTYCVITLNDPTAPVDPSTPIIFSFYFSSEDSDALGIRVRNQVEFTINDPS